MTEMKPPKQANTKLENLFAAAGLALISIGFATNTFSALANLRFIHSPNSLMFYLRFIILLGGGFAIGYLCTRKTNRLAQKSRAFLGTTYAIFTYMLYSLLGIVGFGLQSLLHDSSSIYWWISLTIGSPLFSLLIIAYIAFWSQFKTATLRVSRFTKIAFAALFVAGTVYTIISQGMYLLPNFDSHDPSTFKWLLASVYMTLPLIIAAVTYVLLKTQPRIDKLFYAALVSMFYNILTAALWELRVDPTARPSRFFIVLGAGISIALVGALMWRIRKAVAS